LAPGDEMPVTRSTLDQKLLGARARSGRQFPIGRARQRRERRPVEPEVDDRVFVSLSEAAANLPVVLRRPCGPGRLQLRRPLVFQRGGQLAAMRFEDRLRVGISDLGFPSGGLDGRKARRQRHRTGLTPKPD